jgi:hypothetical protein
MAFHFSEQHIEDYTTWGYTVFRGILPASLIADLRRCCEDGRSLAYERHGPQAQRFQPVAAYTVDRKPFEAYRDLPALRDAISRVLSPEHSFGESERLGVLLQPRDWSYCTAWHRDWRDNVAGVDIASWEAVRYDKAYFNQSNCPLYEDSSTWVVPGSHARDDSPAEIECFPLRPFARPDLTGSAEERELRYLEYCQSMPGAQRLVLDAGDFALYRNTLWHMGNYVPYKKRATLHDSLLTPQFRTWIESASSEAQRRSQGGLLWDNSDRNRGNS